MNDSTLDEFSNQSDPQHGDQFDSTRLQQATENNGIRKYYKDAFDVRNVVGVETGETHDTYKEQKQLHEVIDYAGVDYVVDTYTEIFGINHRVNGSGMKRRFDIRSDTGTKAPSTLEKLLSSNGNQSFKPRYASRLKKSESGGVEWVKIVELQPLINAIIENRVKPYRRIDCGNGVEACLFEYKTLENLNAVVYDTSEKL